MDNRIEITTRYSGGGWQVTSSVTDDSDPDFPKDIYLWTLDKKGGLDKFQAIGNINQVSKYPLYSSDRTNNFGIHLVRYNESSQTVVTEDEASRVSLVLKKSFQLLLDGYEAGREPVTEYYPGEEE